MILRLLQWNPIDFYYIHVFIINLSMDGSIKITDTDINVQGLSILDLIHDSVFLPCVTKKGITERNIIWRAERYLFDSQTFPSL